jgi:hypothetical protein
VRIGPISADYDRASTVVRALHERPAMPLAAAAPCCSRRLGRVAHSSLWSSLLSICVAACTGEITSGPSTLDAGPPPLRTISLAGADAIVLGGACIELAAGERVLDVGSEGDMWIASPDGVRVVDRGGADLGAIPMRAGAPARAVALTDVDAIAIAGANVFRIGPGGVEAVDVPAEMGTPTMLCGDPSSAQEPFFVATAGGLVTREAGTWERWTTEEMQLIALDGLAQESGACSDGSGELWLREATSGVVGGGGAAQWLAPRPALRGADRLVREGALVAALEDGLVVIRDDESAPFETFEVDLGAASAIAIGSGAVWVIAGGALAHRDRDGTWARIESSIASPDAVFADETGGAWIVAREGRACHLSSEAALRVRGLRPHQVIPGDRAIRLVADTAGDAIEVRVDGETVWEAAETDAASRWQTPDLALGGPGWHRLEITATIGGATVERAIEYRVADVRPPSWDADIRPDFEAHCAECHGPAGPRTFLGSVDAYRRFALAIRDRMALGEMPLPPRPRVEREVGDRMQRWIEGGMQP